MCVPVMEKKFLASLVKLNMFLEKPQPQELDQDSKMCVSSRKYLDGDMLTLADCNLLPKLNIVKVRPSSTSWCPNHDHHHQRRNTREQEILQELILLSQSTAGGLSSAGL